MTVICTACLIFVNDPREEKNFVKEEPTLFKDMLDQYNKYAAESKEMQDQGHHDQGSLRVREKYVFWSNNILCQLRKTLKCCFPKHTFMH